MLFARKVMLLFPLEELDFPLVLFCGFARVERAEVFALACFGVLLFGIQAIFA